MGVKCEKQKVYSGVFRATFFAFRISRQDRHQRENSKDFMAYFFATLIKHDICMKCERVQRVFRISRCVSQKTLAKCKKCTADIRIHSDGFNGSEHSMTTCMTNYWQVELETWLEGKWRDILQVCSVANPGGKNFSTCRRVSELTAILCTYSDSNSSQAKKE